MHKQVFYIAALACIAIWSLLGSLVFAQPATYLLGPGDQIEITVFDEDDLSMIVRLGDNGMLNYPFLGQLEVGGMTVGELEQAIISGLKGDYLINPEVTVSVTEYRQLFLNGEVQNPGGIAYQPRLTVERAIALAGGFTERASRNKIDVIRGDDPTETSIPVSLGDPVFPGDIITVRQSFF